MDNQRDEKFTFDERSYNDNGIQEYSSDEIDIPNSKNASVGQQFTQGFKQGINPDYNKLNNPALGGKNIGNHSTLSAPSELDKGKDLLDDKNKLNKNPNKLDNNLGKDNSLTNKNPLPGANPNKKTNNLNEDTNDKKTPSSKKELQGFNPRKSLAGLNPKSMASSVRSKLGLGSQKDGDGEEDNHSNFQPSNILSNGLKSVWNALPLHIKITVGGGVALFVVAFLLILLIFTATTTTFFGSDCDKPSYAVNSSDATEFLCNMQSPFKEGTYTVTGVSGWRNHPDGTGVKFHYGTDVVGSGGANQKIYAVADGTVEVAGTYQGYGNAVKINHNGNFTSLYGHMSSISSEAKNALATKTEIKAGTLLGFQGNTGHSYGVHLHFELSDSNGKYVSANPFFGYSDQGYEECINPDKKVSGSSDCVKSDTPKARNIGRDGFAQICGRSNAFTTNASTSNSCCGTRTSTNSGNIFDFISVWEGGTGEKYQCEINGKQGYKAYQNSGDVLTIGPGLTGQYLGGAKKAGDCVAKSIVEENYKKAESDKRKFIQNTFSSSNLTSYQEDAMVSMAYNGCGKFFGNIAKAAKNDSFSEVWKEMKGCVNAGSKYELGLQRRRKAEFALFVTGDYSKETAKSYMSKSWSTTEYDNYDSEGVIAKKASGTSSNSCSPFSGGSSGNNVIDIAIKELKEWNSYSQEDQYCSAVKKYIKSCSGGSSINEYCAGFVTYALKEAGVFDSLELPSSTCVVSDFKNSSKVTVHKAGGSYTPKPGDLFIKVDQGGHDWGHIGFVEKVNGKTIHTIEGNTDPFEGFCSKGKSDGHGGLVGSGTVRRKTHTEGPKDITHYISY